MAKVITQETLDKMADVVLDYNRTPRRHLFEYPYRADESRQLIKNAEEVAWNILPLQQEQQ